MREAQVVEAVANETQDSVAAARREGPGVFLFSPFFFPEKISTGKYNTHLAQALVDRGCQVTAFTSHPLYPSWKPERSTDLLAGVTAVRGGGWLRYPRWMILRRLVLEAWYALFVARTYLSRRAEAQLLVSVFPPNLFGLVLFAMAPRSVRKVGIVHDLQSILAGGSGSWKARLVTALAGRLERACFDTCDQVIFVSAKMRDHAVERLGIDREKCSVHYPFVSMTFHDQTEGEALLPLMRPERLNIVYSGALGKKQNPDGLLEFMATVARREPDVACHVFSEGPDFDRLRGPYANALRFRELVPADQLNELYRRSDVQIIPQAESLADGALPSKLPNLMAAGVPLLAICDPGSELGELIREARAGVVVDSWDGEALRAGFQAMRAYVRAESREQRKLRLRQFVAERFSLQALTDQILRTERPRR